MTLFGLEVERSYWLATIGVVLGIYLWFFLTVAVKFVDTRNAKIVTQNFEELQTLKEQISLLQRLKFDNVVYTEAVLPILPESLNRIDTIHFTVYTTLSVDEYSVKETAQFVEKIYNTIIADTELYNFNPYEKFTIYIYKDAQQYKELTKRPVWSGGFVLNRKIYTFEGQHLKYILSHEITHLIFNDFMNGKAEKISQWLNEGLAMYEETKTTGIKKPQFDRTKRIPIDEFLIFDLSNAEAEKVNLWYQQAESLVTFLIEKRAKLKFYNFLVKLKETENVNEALFWGYQSEFKSIGDLENVWLKE
ncbi:MAG: hypothetical protein AB1349_11615 [Elusimicrobiota bacterium]